VLAEAVRAAGAQEEEAKASAAAGWVGRVRAAGSARMA